MPQVAGDVCAAPADSPLIVVPVRNDHSISADAEAVKLVDDITILGGPSGTSEDADPERRQVLTFGVRAAVLDPQVLIKV